jgi:Tfp pilus assembly protein PilF
MQSERFRELAKMEETATILINERKYKEASLILDQIVSEAPDWRHGMAHYNLAQCHEVLGEPEAAKTSYLKAMKHDDLPVPNDVFLGGYAAFLYRHGAPSEAFEAYLKLVRAYRARQDQQSIRNIVPMLLDLGGKLGLTPQQIRAQMQETGSE